MKIFAVNLESEPHKKKHILAEAEKYNLEIEVVKAVAGKNLSEEELDEMVIDHKENMLTKSEIGCSLSHLSIYKRMMDEDIPIALVLEDDAVLLEDISNILVDIEQFDNKKPNVYILTIVERYYSRPKYSFGATILHKVFRTTRTHGYIINNNAARRMYKHFFPVWLEADMWESFKLIAGINIYGKTPYVIDDGDKNNEQSSIQKERALLVSARRDYRAKVLAQKPGYIIKRFFYRMTRLFARKY